MTFTQALFSFEGRINRLAYFGYGAALVLIMAVGVAVCASTLNTDAVALGVVVGAASFIMFCWGGYALAAKRFHDIGYTAKYLWACAFVALASTSLATAAPALSIILNLINIGASLFLLFTPGEKGSNQYGADPLT